MFLSDFVFIFVGVVCRKTRPLASTRSCSTKVDRQEMETDETSTKANSNTCRVSFIKKQILAQPPFCLSSQTPYEKSTQSGSQGQQ
jgi:hypothetical protein